RVYYDSHEYFTEAEGLTGHPFKKRIWLRIEKWILPRLSNMYTVNESIASFYRDRYHIPVYVVRNVPPGRPLPPLKSRQELGLPADKRLIILQGAYIDPDRGAREAVEAMEFVDNALLMIIGSGRDLPVVQQMAAAPQLKDRVLFRPKLPFDELQQYTRQADVGLTLDKPVHLNYTYSLPNKIFDYVHAGIPVVASRLPELERLINEYRIGALVDEVTPQKIAAAINTVLSQPKSNWSDVLKQCAEANNWQKESEIFTEIYRDLLSDTRA
ncbi:MAG: glycosyltransferase, partial [Flavobacteriales bacterium]|nr:glycosyltransferase [Flavobacteriales bacterium]